MMDRTLLRELEINDPVTDRSILRSFFFFSFFRSPLSTPLPTLSYSPTHRPALSLFFFISKHYFYRIDETDFHVERRHPRIRLLTHRFVKFVCFFLLFYFLRDEKYTFSPFRFNLRVKRVGEIGNISFSCA